MNKFDDIIREKLSNLEPPFDASAWNDMADKMFDDVISDKLSDYTAPNDPNAWNTVERALDGPSGNSFQKALISGVAASVVLGALFTTLPDIGPSTLPQDEVVEDLTTTTVEPAITGEQHAAYTEETEHIPQEVHEIAFSSATTQVEEAVDQTSVTSEDPKRGTLQVNNESHDAGSNVENANEASATVATTLSASSIDFKARGIQCPGSKITFTAVVSDEKAQIEWLFDGIHFSEGANVKMAFDEAGDLHEARMTVRYADGTSQTISKEIEIFATPTPDFTFETNANNDCFNQELILSATPSDNTYKWVLDGDSIGKGTQLSQLVESGNHNVGLLTINEYGCTSFDRMLVTVDEGLKVWMPSAFSPDNDGLNDKWFPEGLEYVQSFELQIKRALDDVVVYTTKEMAPWDGSINGTAERAKFGEQYIYTVIMTDKCGNRAQRSGLINIVDL